MWVVHDPFPVPPGSTGAPTHVLETRCGTHEWRDARPSRATGVGLAPVRYKGSNSGAPERPCMSLGGLCAYTDVPCLVRAKRSVYESHIRFLRGPSK